MAYNHGEMVVPVHCQAKVLQPILHFVEGRYALKPNIESIPKTDKSMQDKRSR